MKKALLVLPIAEIPILAPNLASAIAIDGHCVGFPLLLGSYIGA